MARVFISHASEDRELADEVYGWLAGDGHEVFLDHHPDEGIAVGEAWEQRLYERLRWADAMICLVTSAFLASPWCAAEVGIARSQGNRLLPLLAERGVEYPLLEWSQYADLVSDPEAARAALTAALRRVDVAGGWGWPDGRSPFPGLRPFDTDQHRVFFGRAAEVEALAGLLRSPAEQAGRSVLLVVGPSGCGKSSLLRAGLLPVAAEEPGWWTLAPFAPGAHPDAALTRELAVGARQVGLDWTLAQVRERLGEGRLSELADELLLAAPGEVRRRHLLVVVDQLEELLTQATPVARSRFAELLRPALGNPIQVVATLRPEFLTQLLASPELAGLPMRVFTLRPLRREALATVITGPARLAGIGIDEQLVDRLVGDTDTGEALPLLAFTLEQLADGVGRGGQLSAARYEQLGGVQGALVRQADAALADACAASGRTADQVIGGLLRLVTVDEQGRPTRWRVDRGELPEPVRVELDAFVARRLLSTDTDNGAVVVGVTHEAFLSAWPPLASAISAAASALRMRWSVEHAAAEWDEEGRSSTRLWERGQLAAAVTNTGARMGSVSRSTGHPGTATPSIPQRWLSGWVPAGNRVLVTDKVELSQRARAFLHASIRVDRRRRRRASSILSVLLVLAITAAGVAVNRQYAARQQQRAAQLQQRIAIAHGLVARADAAREGNPHLALQLGIAAQRIHADGETQASLVHTLTTTHYTATLTSHINGEGPVAFAPKGRTLAVGSGSGSTVVFWDLSDPTQPRRLGQLSTGYSADFGVSMAFAADGRTLATTGLSGRVPTVILWDLSDRAHPRRLGQPLTGHSDTPLSVAFAPDGRTLATGIGSSSGSDQTTIALWDLSDRARPRRLGQPLTAHSINVGSVAFAPDGRTLATGGFDGKAILWDVSDRARPRRLGQPLTVTSRMYGVSVAFASDGRTLATAGASDSGNKVVLWDLSDRAQPRRLGQPLTGDINDFGVSVAFAPNRPILATTAGSTVILWDFSNRGQPRQLGQPLAGHSNAVGSVALSPDGGVLASASGTVILWDVTNQAQPRQLGKPLGGDRIGVGSVAFAPDRRILATGSGGASSGDGGSGAIVLWDLSNRVRPHRLGQSLIGPSIDVESVAFAPDGTTLATANFNGIVDLWDVSNPAQPRPLGQPLTGDSIRVTKANISRWTVQAVM
jgi:WD40 repeat protein